MPTIKPMLVVGLGASSGGIAVLKDFFRHLPANTGNAYVVILHLSPDHNSILAEILQTTSKIPVSQVTERVHIKPDHVYVIPPNRSLSVVDGHLDVSEVVGFQARRAPVDIFFRTLADAREAHSVCVVLSGSGTDGSMGLKRIKERGGIAIAQEPAEAEFQDMPRNAVATGLVDYVLPVREIPAKILAYQEHLRRLPAHEPSDERPTDEELVRDVLGEVRTRTGHDFLQYKRSMILRRIQRRMGVNDIAELDRYRDYIRSDQDEASALLRDLLISVTNFFRDHEAWAVLESTIIPRLIAGKGSDSPIRAWIAGCATGEEAYSIAMLLSEACGGLTTPSQFQLFATDIDADAIASARIGKYTSAEVADISSDRLSRFFSHEKDSYRVRPELRATILFAVHNVLRDPPFSQLDLVSCRNLLIYLNRTAQDRVIELTHFALRPGGYLFLGASELLVSLGDLFHVADKEHRIAESRAVPRRLSRRAAPPTIDLPVLAEPDSLPGDGELPSRRRPSPLEMHQRLLEAYGPPSIVVNEDYDILHVSPHAGRYLQVPGGEPSSNLLTLVRPELRLALRAALYLATQQHVSAEAADLPVSDADGAHRVTLRVRPPADTNAPDGGLILVLFEPVNGPIEAAPPAAAVGPLEPAVRQLEDALTDVRARLRGATQDYESQYGEFRASTEELQAMNEELRSSAEELETSKEELQSVNEELTTVNQELKIKVEEVTQANNDFRNLMNSTQIATIFLDRLLRIKQFTPRATDIFNLLPADIGRRLLDLTHTLLYDGLRADMEQVLERFQIVERELRGQTDTWYAMRMLPYHTSDNRLDGVVLTFIDITARKNAAHLLQRAQEQLVLAQRASGSALWERDLVSNVHIWSPEMYQLRGFSDATSAEAADHLAGIHTEDRGHVVRKLDHALSHQESDWNAEFRVVRGDGSTRWVAERGTIVYADDRPLRMLGIDFDITQRRSAEAARARLASIVDLSNDAIISFDFKGHIVSWNRGAEQLVGRSEREAVGDDLSSILLSEDGRAGETVFSLIERRTRVRDFVTIVRAKDGGHVDVSIAASPITDDAGVLIGGSMIIRDISVHAEMERTMRHVNEELERRVGVRTADLTAANDALRLEVRHREAAEAKANELLTQLTLAQEEERRRIARDLHDHLGQQLTALRLSLAVCREGSFDGEACRTHLAHAESVAMRLDADIDFLAWELRPSPLEAGIVSAIETYAHEWSNHFGIPIDIHTAGFGDGRLAPLVELSLYRIAQEALNNTAKHAQADRVALILEQRDGHAVLIVEDNGRGFELTDELGDATHPRLGLIGMRERIARISGTIEFESEPQTGTAVLARVPLSQSSS